MGAITLATVLKMSLELLLGVCIKLFCDNGRIAWADFKSDFLFWIPGNVQEPGDGLSRQVTEMGANLTHDVPVALPAK